jgi:hypothetical protein
MCILMANPNQSLIDAFFAQICINRRNAQLNNVPPQRYDNLLTSPYLPQNGGFTREQLDMRRKAEILTYNSNRMLKANSLTKSQKFSTLVNNNIKNVPVYKNQCFTDEKGNLITTPSSSCGVPGDVIDIYNDQTIPLYMFSDGNTTKAITLNQDNNYFFQ